MDIDSAAFLVNAAAAIAKTGLGFGSAVQTLVDELIALWEPFKQVFILDIIHWDVKVLIPAYEWSVILEFPIED